MFDLKGKVAVITGGANGIGAAVLRKFLDEDVKFLAFLDINETSGLSLEKDLQTQYGKDSAKFYKCDVTKDEELFRVFNEILKNHEYIDVVLNNAGILNETMSMYKREIEINFTAVVTSTFKALEMMRKDKGGAGGTIINISSTAALTLSTTPITSVYSATKAAVLLFSAQMGMEPYYQHTGVRVITMCFGLSDTVILENVKAFDDITTESVKNIINASHIQPIEPCAAGIVEAYKKGKTGSVWLVRNSELTDITERVSKAYQVLSGQIEI